MDDSTVTQFSGEWQLGPYRIEGMLGAGGMGTVYRATDTRLGRPVALKIAAAQYSERFRREAKAISALNHPHICTLYDVGPNYLVMELLEGSTLSDEIKDGPLAPETAARYGAQIASALAEAHARGVVHRDLKPGNIMITRHGVKVLDFGLAKVATEPGLTMTNIIMGTPAYMAPEQTEGREADAPADLFALGLVLYKMLTGRLPVSRCLSGQHARQRNGCFHRAAVPGRSKVCLPMEQVNSSTARKRPGTPSAQRSGGSPGTVGARTAGAAPARGDRWRGRGARSCCGCVVVLSPRRNTSTTMAGCLARLHDFDVSGRRSNAIGFPGWQVRRLLLEGTAKRRTFGHLHNSAGWPGGAKAVDA